MGGKRQGLEKKPTGERAKEKIVHESFEWKLKGKPGKGGV